MAKNEVKITVTAKDDASQKISNIRKNLKNLGFDVSKMDVSYETAGSAQDDFLEKTALFMTGLNQGIMVVQKVADVARQAYEFSVEMAAMERMTTASDNMARSVGLNMDEIVTKVGAASLGMVSDIDIMSSATKAMMLGVGSSADDLAALMETAAVRGQAMGLTTQQAFNDIVTGIGRQSKLILDNLGIVLNLEEVYQDYADTVGKSVDDLDDFEKKQAMVNAVLKDTEDLLETTGGLVLDNAGQWEKLTSNIDNLKLTVAGVSAGPLAEMPKMLNVWLEEIDREIDFANLRGGLKEAGIDVREFNKAWRDNTNFAGWTKDNKTAAEILDDMMVSLNDKANAWVELTGDAEGGTRRWTEAQQGLNAELAGAPEWGLAVNAEAMESAVEAVVNMTDYYKSMIGLTEKYSGTLETIDEKQSRLNDLLSIEGGGYLDGVYMKASDVAGAIDDIQLEIEELESSMESMANQMVIDAAIAELALDGIIDEEDFEKIMNLEVAMGESSRAGADAAISQFNRAMGYWDALKFADKTLTLHIKALGAENYEEVPNWWDVAGGGLVYANRSAGGLTPAAGGYWVGEVGPEPFFPAQDGRIMSHSDAMTAMRGGGRGGGQPVVVNINTPFNFADNVWVENELMPYIRDAFDKVQL